MWGGRVSSIISFPLGPSRHLPCSQQDIEERVQSFKEMCYRWMAIQHNEFLISRMYVKNKSKIVSQSVALDSLGILIRDTKGEPR